jgi:GT2 family glycosyltransferase
MRPETVNIIVIGYNVPKLERACLKAVHANTVHPYLLTYYDNFTSGMTLTQVWNKLIEYSPCKFICLLNNDTEVSPDWLTFMMDSLGKEIDGKTVGFVGPSTNSCHSPQKGIPTREEALQHRGEVELMQAPISGFCLLFSRETWHDLHGMDERYGLYGQESDFIDRAKLFLDLVCAWRKDAFVFHHGEASVKAHKVNVAEERQRAKAIYWADRG